MGFKASDPLPVVCDHKVSPSAPRVGSAVIVCDGPRVLLGRRGKQPEFGKWVLPGGKISPFEKIDDAARREVLEETGLEVEVRSRLGVFEIINPPDEHRIIIYSEAVPAGGQLAASSDLLEVRWFTAPELEAADMTSFVRSVLTFAGRLQTPLERAG
jgi:8-oxo-dGTP diphosphatase